MALGAVGIIGALAIAAGARAADPDALWKIVHGRCVPDQQANNDPKPCAALDLTGGEAGGHAILKDINGATQFLLIPTRRLTGIESPEILAADAPNYFAAAWAARAETEAAAHRLLPRTVIGLAINAATARSQNQLHIHIDCLRPDIIQTLRSQIGAVGPDWAPFPATLAGQSFLARRLDEPSLATNNPFRLVADGVPGAASDMAHQTIILAGADLPDGQPGFVLLAGRVDPAQAESGHGEDLQDHACAAAHTTGG